MKKYRTDKIIRVFVEKLGFEKINPDSDFQILYLHNKKTDDIVSVDKDKQRLPEDYVEKAILDEGRIIRLDYFKLFYDHLL